MEDDGPPLNDPILEAEIRELIAQGQTIDAVKRLREQEGWDLAKAKLWVDREVAARSGWTRPPTKPCPSCGRPLRTDAAKQCFACGADWH